MTDITSFSVALPDELYWVELTKGTLENPVEIESVIPSDSVYDITFESTNPSVATITEEGIITPVSLGETTIIATDNITELSESLLISIVSTDIYVPDESIEVSFTGEDGEGVATHVYNGPSKITVTETNESGLSNGDVVTYTLTTEYGYTVNGSEVDTILKLVDGLTVIDRTLTSFEISLPGDITTIDVNSGSLSDPIGVSGISPDNAVYNLDYTTNTPDIINVSDAGIITPNNIGSATVTVYDTVSGVSRSVSFEVTPTDITLTKDDYGLIYVGNSGNGGAILDTRDISNISLRIENSTGLSNGGVVTVIITADGNYTVNGVDTYNDTYTVSGLEVVTIELISFNTRLVNDVVNPIAGLDYQLEIYDVINQAAELDGAIYESLNSNATVTDNGLVTVINNGPVIIRTTIDGITSELDLVSLNKVIIRDEDINVVISGKNSVATAEIVTEITGVNISVTPNEKIYNGDVLTVSVSGGEYDSINGSNVYTFPYLVSGLTRLITAFSISSPDTFVGVGKTSQIAVTNVLPAGVYVSDAKYTTNDDTVLDVTTNGLMSGVSTGSAVITVEIDGLIKTLSIDVIKTDVTGFSAIATASNIAVGKTCKVNVYNVAPIHADVSSLAFTSSDITVATVDSFGTVTARAVGVANITATINGIGQTVVVYVSSAIQPVVVTGTQYDVTDDGLRYPIAHATIGGNLIDSDSNRIYGFTNVSGNEWKRTVTGEKLTRVQTYGGEYAYPQYTVEKVYIGMKTYDGNLMNLNSDVIMGYQKNEEGLYYIPTEADKLYVVIPQYDDDSGKYFGYKDGDGVLRSHDMKNISEQYVFISGDRWMANGIRYQYDELFKYVKPIGKASASGRLLDNQGNVVYGFHRTTVLADNTWVRNTDLVGEDGPISKDGIQYYAQYTPEKDMIGFSSIDGILRDNKLNIIAMYDKDYSGTWVVSLRLNSNGIRIPKYSSEGKLVGYTNGAGTLVSEDGSLIDNYAEQSDGTWLEIESPKPSVIVTRDYQLKTTTTEIVDEVIPVDYLQDIINQAPMESRMTFEFIADYIKDMEPGSDTPESEIIKWQERLYKYLIKLIREESDDAVAYKNIRGLVAIFAANSGEKQALNFRYIGRYAGQVKLSDAQKQEFVTLLYTLQELAIHGNKVNIDWRAFRVSMITSYQDVMVQRVTGAFNITNV